jgi:hypothetical protein
MIRKEVECSVLQACYTWHDAEDFSVRGGYDSWLDTGSRILQLSDESPRILRMHQRCSEIEDVHS